MHEEGSPILKNPFLKTKNSFSVGSRMSDAERCCAQAVARGEKLKFSLIKHGLAYKAKTPSYERVRRLVAQEKKKLTEKKAARAQKKSAIYKVCFVSCLFLFRVCFCFMFVLLCFILFYFICKHNEHLMHLRARQNTLTFNNSRKLRPTPSTPRNNARNSWKA